MNKNIIVNLYVPNNIASKDIKKVLTIPKGEIEKSLITMGNFSMSLSIGDRTDKNGQGYKRSKLQN